MAIKKYYIRLDGSGRKIPGSGVIRNKKPSIGRWVEEDVETCCVPAVLVTATPSDVTTDNATVTLLCDAVTFAEYTLTFTAVTTIDGLTAELNSQLGFLGRFTNNGTIITLHYLLEIAENLCAGTTTMTIVSA